MLLLLFSFDPFRDNLRLKTMPQGDNRFGDRFIL